MAFVKKSFNLDSDLAQGLDDFIAKNPGLSATFVFNNAVKAWLKHPVLNLTAPEKRLHTDEDVDAFYAEHGGLMDRLSK